MKPLFKITIILFLLFSIGFSFFRHFHFSIDGDMAAIVLPNNSYKTVLNDPFGINVLLHDSLYPATNRFFTHFFMFVYYKNAPIFFQSFVSPLDSVYLACALLKTIVQFLIIYLLSVYITNKNKFWNFDSLFAASLITPLFQTFGYNTFMGVIDHSNTYTCFYALALLLVILFFLPFYTGAVNKQDYNFSKLTISFLLLVAIVLSFNGPLNPAVILIIGPVIITYLFIVGFKNFTGIKIIDRVSFSIKNIPRKLFFVLAFAIALSLYSLYIGKNNSENLWETIPIAERYSRLVKGIQSQFTNTWAYDLILFMILANAITIYSSKPTHAGKQILFLLKWAGICSAIYILLLPLGGYREYRPDIIRMDTILPVTLALILFYGHSTYYIIKNLNSNFKFFYYIFVLIFSCHFIIKDAVFIKENECERDALEKISQSPDKIVALDNGCWIMFWGKITNPNDSKTAMELLRHWNIIKEDKLYYQK